MEARHATTKLHQEMTSHMLHDGLARSPDVPEPCEDRAVGWSSVVPDLNSPRPMPTNPGRWASNPRHSGEVASVAGGTKSAWGTGCRTEGTPAVRRTTGDPDQIPRKSRALQALPPGRNDGS